MMRAFDHISAASAEDAIERLAERQDGEARAIAGGTDLLTLMKADLVSPARLIDLKPLTRLRGIKRQPGGAISIGALTTLADMERDAGIAIAFPVLIQAIQDAATPQLR